MRRSERYLFSPGMRWSFYCTCKGTKAWIDSFIVCRTWNKHRSGAASRPWTQTWRWLEVGWAVLKRFDAWGQSSMRQWHIVEAPVGWRQTGRRKMDIGPCCSSFRWGNSDHSQLTLSQAPTIFTSSLPSLSLPLSCFGTDDGHPVLICTRFSFIWFIWTKHGLVIYLKSYHTWEPPEMVTNG